MADDGTKRHALSSFDGIICIGGEDWWYHNRGHFDFQIMRRLAKSMPVLFVNSIAVRMPAISHNKREFAAKFGRKLRSLARGLVEAEENFWVFSPFSIPGPAAERLARWALPPQIRLAAARAGIRQPLLWVHCPAGAALADELDYRALVLQRTDRFEAFPEADPVVVGRQIAQLKARADLVVYCNADMMVQETGTARDQLLLTHGVDLDSFVRAGRSGEAPADIAHIPTPRVGFIGGIDAHTFAPSLLRDVATAMPNAQFVLVGGCSLPEGWCELPNVHQIGRRPYADISGYMAAMDVLIMPWNDSEWIRACNPIKLKEYLAVGRPVVSTDFPALAPYRDIVRVAGDAPGFAAAIRDALAEPYDAARAHAHVATESWDGKAEILAARLREVVEQKNIEAARASRVA